MTDDLVRRLRKLKYKSCNEAADRIEALYDQVVNMDSVYRNRAEAAEQALAEAVKFKFLAGVAWGCLDLMDNMLDDPKGFATEIQRRDDECMKAIAHMARVAGEARTERLAGALEKIAEGGLQGAAIARAALAEEPKG